MTEHNPYDVAAQQRRDEALKRALRTPPKPHQRQKDEDGQKEGGENPAPKDDAKD